VRTVAVAAVVLLLLVPLAQVLPLSLMEIIMTEEALVAPALALALAVWLERNHPRGHLIPWTIITVLIYQQQRKLRVITSIQDYAIRLDITQGKRIRVLVL